MTWLQNWEWGRFFFTLSSIGVWTYAIARISYVKGYSDGRDKSLIRIVSKIKRYDDEWK